MHSLHTLLPSHGQRYKRNLPRHQCAAQCACPAGGQGGNPPWAMGFHGANRVSASSALLHWRRGEGEKGRRGEGEKHPCGKVQCRYTANFQPHPCAAGSSFRCVGNAGRPVEKRCPTRVHSPPGKLVQKRWWVVARLQPPPPTIAADCGPLRPSADCCLTAFLEAA